MEFKKFGKIKQLKNFRMHITQKIHGTNTHIYVYEENGLYKARAGARNRWIFPEDDHFGFAKFVDDNEKTLTEALGLGRHYGEWAGAGINSGEGLSEKKFFLFDWWRYPADKFHHQLSTVPLLYEGDFDLCKIDECMENLKVKGSHIADYDKPEGVVVMVGGERYKKTFSTEEDAWVKPITKNKNPKTFIDYGYLCQPLRLEKLLSKDEIYLKDYPETLPKIMSDYVSDLIEEGQIKRDEAKAIKKGATSQIFAFVRHFINMM